MVLLKIFIIFIQLGILFFLSVNSTYSTDTFKRISNNPVISYSSDSSWNGISVGSTSVVNIGNNYRMWFQGSNGSLWRIGYTDTNNISQWNNVITQANELVINNDGNIHDPKVIFQNNLYSIWYASSDWAINKIQINYSESIDGVNWFKPINNVIPATFDWENNRGISFPTTLFIKNKYRMWYGANGRYNSSTRWRIGYAESEDGINWVKHPEPVLKADQAWEGMDVGNPTVVYDGKLYHMWYHGDRDIGHAISDDGIKWEKDKNNPVLTPSTDENAFDNRRVLNPFVLKKDDKYYMWYTGQNKDGRWQIGLATESLTPTSTPTPSPSPAITPPLSSSPIILIPGLGASWNPHALFSCDLRVSSNWKLAPYVSVYNRLIKTLTKNAGYKLNKDVYVYGYDWRQGLDTGGNNLKNYIEVILKEHLPGTKVRLIGHSLGGLEIRSLMTNFPDFDRIESILTIGTPHSGTLAAYPIWEKGEIQADDRVARIAINNLINICKLKLRPEISRISGSPQIKVKSDREVIQKIMPVMKQLLPVFDYIRIKGVILGSNKLFNQNDWINQHPDFASSIPIFTISGNNQPTLRYINVTETSGKEKINGDWQDGKPISWNKINEGDGTVLTASSQVSHANNTIIVGDHSGLVYSADGIKQILLYLGLKDVKIAVDEPNPEIESKSVLTVSSDNTSEMTLFDPKRNVNQSKDNIIAVYNPIAGVYRLKIQAKENDISNLYISFLSDYENNLSKYFQIKTPKNKTSEFLISFTNFKTTNINLIPIKL